MGAAGEDLGTTLRSVAAVYYAKAGQVALVAGRATTMDYYDRLLTDANLLSEAPPR